EDGIRDFHVTGVQTCALPILPEIKIDRELSLQDITPKFYRILKQFAPFGPGNMTPIFMTQNVYDTGYGKCVGEDENHLRVTLNQSGNEKLVAIGFGLGKKLEKITNRKPFKIVYSIDENHWNDKTTLQLKLRDIK